MAHRLVDLLKALDEGALVRRRKWSPTTFIIKDGEKYVYEDGFVVRDFPDLYADDWEIYDITGRIPTEKYLVARKEGVFTTSCRKEKIEIPIPRLSHDEPVTSSLGPLSIECCPKHNPALGLLDQLKERVSDLAHSLSRK